MRYRVLFKICLLASIALVLDACPTAKLPHPKNTEKDSSHPKTNTVLSAQPENAWGKIATHYRFSQDTSRPAVKNEIHWYLRHKQYITELSKNSRPYIYYIYQQTQKRNLPAELALIPMVESNYNPFKYSSAGATGLWQIMPSTGSGNGLVMNWWCDERRNVITSTKTALDYLNYLHQNFGNWLLAIAAYDSGAGTVQAAIDRNKAQHQPTDFWDLSLPKETKDYVPKLLAIAAIIQHPQKYHVDLINVPAKSFFSVVKMHKQITLNEVAKLSNTNVKTVQRLNPAFRHEITPPHEKYALLLPKNKAELFKVHFDAQTTQHAHQKYHTVHAHSNSVSSATKINGKIAEKRSSLHHLTFIIHRVKAGESLDLIAQLYHVTVHNLIHWNRVLVNEHFLQIGEPLRVYLNYEKT